MKPLTSAGLLIENYLGAADGILDGY